MKALQGVNELLTIDQVQQRLACSRKVVIGLIRANRLPSAFKVGHEWRVPASDIDAYIAARRVQPTGGAA